jgi:hypothetical protein
MHWAHSDIMDFDHFSRRKWCEEISKINKKVMAGDIEKSLGDFR